MLCKLLLNVLQCQRGDVVKRHVVRFERTGGVRFSTKTKLFGIHYWDWMMMPRVPQSIRCQITFSEQLNGTLCIERLNFSHDKSRMTLWFVSVRIVVVFNLWLVRIKSTNSERHENVVNDFCVQVLLIQLPEGINASTCCHHNTF